MRSNEATSFQHGTGVLVQIADTHFVLTAGHVADCLADPGTTISLGAAVDGERVVHLESVHWASSGALGRIDRGRDPSDVAALVLEPRVVDRLKPQLRFATLDEIDHRPGSSRSQYMLVGYPIAIGRRDTERRVIATPPIALGVRRRRPPTNVEFPFHPRVNLAFGYAPDDVYDADGAPTSVPDLRGVSGGGVWRFLGGGHAQSHVDPRSVRLVAIETSCSPAGGWIRCTRISTVLRLIYDRAPDMPSVGVGIRRAMLLTHPWLATSS